MDVIAEGVETPGELNYLRRHNCDEIQGLYFSRPVPAVEFEEQLKSGNHLEIPVEKIENSILVVDDEEEVRASLRRMLILDGYNIFTAASAADGFELLANNRIGVVLSDQRMPVMNGSVFLYRAREIHPETVRILMSGHADIDILTDAVNQGTIYTFLSKPWEDDHVRYIIAEAFRYGESIQS
jgi:DNA-binding NtrC family response regulator